MDITKDKDTTEYLARSAHHHPTTDATDLTGANTSIYNTPTNAYGTTSLTDTGFGTATYGNTDISGYRSSNTDTYGGHRINKGQAYGTDIDAARSSRYDEIIDNINAAAKVSNTTRKSDRDTGTGYGQGLRNTFDVSPGRNVEETGYGSRTDFRR